MPPSFRLVYADIWPQLAGTSALSQALYFRLAAGPDARAFPVTPMRMRALADDLQVSLQALRPALQTLVERNLIMLDNAAAPTLAYCPARMRHEFPRHLAHHKAWSRQVLDYHWASFGQQLAEDIQLRPPTPYPTPPPTPTPTPYPRGGVGKDTMDTDSTSYYLSPAADAAADDWDRLVADMGSKQGTLLDAADAPRTRDTGAKQAKAILHRKLASEAAKRWSQTMVPPNAPVQADAAWMKLNARNVATVVAALGNIRYLQTLFEYSKDNLPYYAGLPYGQHAQVRVWTMTEWCSRANVEKVHAQLAAWMLREHGRETRIVLDWSRKPEPEMLEDVQ